MEGNFYSKDEITVLPTELSILGYAGKVLSPLIPTTSLYNFPKGRLKWQQPLSVPFLGHSSARNNSTRAGCSSPPSQTSPFPPPQAQPQHLACRGGSKSSSLTLFQPCSPWKGLGRLKSLLQFYFTRSCTSSVPELRLALPKGITAGYFWSDYLMPEQSKAMG